MINLQAVHNTMIRLINHFAPMLTIHNTVHNTMRNTMRNTMHSTIHNTMHSTMHSTMIRLINHFVGTP